MVGVGLVVAVTIIGGRPRAAAAGTPTLSPPLEVVPTTRGARPMRIGFDWSPPCRVRATRIVENARRKAVLTFDQVLTARGEHLDVVMERARFLRVDGAEPSDVPPDALANASVEFLFSPRLAVSRAGRFLAVRDGAAAVEMLLKGLPLAEASAQRWGIELRLRERDWLLMLERAAEIDWNVRTGWWSGRTFIEGKPIAFERVVESRVPPWKARARVQMVHRGMVAGRPDLVLLETVETIDGAEGLKVAVAADAYAARRQGRPARVLTSGSMVLRVTVAMDPVAGRAHRVRTSGEHSIDGAKSFQTTDTAFDWKNAEGCTRAAR